MATQRPFDYNRKDYLDRLNDLYNSGMPRVLVDPADPDSEPTDVIVDRQLVFNDNGGVCDVMNSINLTFDESCLADGWAVFVNVVAGTATLDVGSAGTTFIGGLSSKTITAGNAALISCNGTQFRIFRMSAV